MSAEARREYHRPLDVKRGRVELAHGAGGRATAQLVEELFLAAFDNEWLRPLNDAASLPVPAGRLVMATDSHVVSPLFFPGGDIGSLSVHGTVNDVAMAGAMPLYLAAGFVLEEGYPLADLKRIVASMAAAAKAAGVPVVTGDTKVVEQGKGDGVYITTTGVGVAPAGIVLDGAAAREGDAIFVSGTIGDHGVAIMSKRENLEFDLFSENPERRLLPRSDKVTLRTNVYQSANRQLVLTATSRVVSPESVESIGQELCQNTVEELAKEKFIAR